MNYEKLFDLVDAKVQAKAYPEPEGMEIIHALGLFSEFRAYLEAKLQPQGQIAPSKDFPNDVRIHVKRYMTQKASPDFNFMAQRNGDIPMPYRIMQGHIIDETAGMYKMQLRGGILSETHCIKCGRELTHPVSRYFGIGPECGGHNHVNPFNSDEELQAAITEMKTKLENVVWTGWVIKSAITTMEKVG